MIPSSSAANSGLHIVEALSSTCGVTQDPGGGKWIWARIVP
ncbi:hypothetical protein [Spirillospora sp. CA-128828]